MVIKIVKELYYYIRYILVLPILVVDIIVESLVLIFMFTFLPKNYNFPRHYHRWAKRVLVLMGVKLEIFGEENIAEDGTYIYASNHASQTDIPISYAAIKTKVSIIYKKELERIPFFGWMLNRCYFIAIDRTDARKAMASVFEALNLIKQGVNIIIFPEGTRSADGNVQEFKRGTFVIASKSGTPVLPYTIVGSNKILPKGSLFFRPGKVAVVFHKPYTFPEKMTKEEEIEHLENIRKIIISGFEKAKKHLAIS